jgi:hypothetical protein
VTTAPPAATSDTPPASSNGSGMRTAGLVIGGVGVAGIVVGAVTGILAMGNESDSKNRCPNTTCTDATGVNENNSASTQATISTIGFVAGGALVVTGAVLFLVAPKSHATTTALRIVPAVGRGELGLGLGGAW